MSRTHVFYILTANWNIAKKYTRVLIDPAGVLTFIINALSDTPVNKYGDRTGTMLSSRFSSAVQLNLFHAFHEAAKASEREWLWKISVNDKTWFRKNQVSLEGEGNDVTILGSLMGSCSSREWVGLPYRPCSGFLGLLLIFFTMSFYDDAQQWLNKIADKLTF